jgi:hypothetical protein
VNEAPMQPVSAVRAAKTSERTSDETNPQPAARVRG